MFLNKFNIRIFLLTGCLCIIALLNTGMAGADDWTTFQKDTYNTGLTSDAFPAQEPNVVWDVLSSSGGGMSASTGVDSCPIVVGDTVYVLSDGGKLFAYNKETGAQIWSNSAGSSAGTTTSFQLSTPAYGDGRIFIGTSDGYIAAFNAQTGTKVWGDIQLDSAAPFDQVNTPVLYDNGYIYMGTWTGGKYYCYDEDGNFVWSYTPSSGNGYYWAGAAVIGNYIVFGDESGELTSLNRLTGAKIDEIDVFEELGLSVSNDNIRSSVVYDASTGRIYSSSEAGYCFYLGFTGSGTFDLSDMQSAYTGLSTSTPAIYNGRVYLGTGSVLAGSNLHNFYCLDAETLDVIWSKTLSGVIQASPVISTVLDDGDGEIYICFTTNEQDGKVYCMKDFTGNTVATTEWTWEQPSGENEYVLQGVAVSDGWLYLGNDAGYVFGLNYDENADWNPWNDLDSEGSPDGTYITISEFIEAYNCYKNSSPAPETGASVDISRLIGVYNAYKGSTPM